MSTKGGPPLVIRPKRPPLQGLRPRHAPAAGRDAPRRRVLALALTGAAHVALVGILFWHFTTPQPPQAKPTLADLQVTLVPKPTPPGPPDAAEAQAGAPTIALPTPPAVVAPTITIAAVPPNTSDLLSQSQLAGAARAGEGGGGGGGCDMARAVQQALRRDPLVRTAVAGADRIGKASMLWNGDWVQSGGQEGKGLAAVRQAVIWEIGFSPEACRNARVHGLVLVTLADGATRFAIGSGDWRWSDLLGMRAVH